MRNKRAGAIIVTSVMAVALVGAALWLSRKNAGESVVSQTTQVPRHAVELRDGRLVLKSQNVPFTGVMFEQTSGGRRLTEVPVEDGRVHGLARGWHENGKLEVEEPFTGGISDGVRTRWYPSGNKRNTATIVRGTLHGPYTEWHENGQLAVKMSLAHGRGEGPCETWLPDGQLKSRVTLKEGQPINSDQLAGIPVPEHTDNP